MDYEKIKLMVNIINQQTTRLNVTNIGLEIELEM